MTTRATRGSVALVTLGCTRNEVDSEELAGRLAADGWRLVEDAADADVAVVNTCGFVEQAKKDSIDTLLEAADLKESGRTRAVVAVGCLAERYGRTLAEELPDADAVLGFDSYAQMSTHLQSVLAGGRPPAHVPGDRRRLLPLAPLARPAASGAVALPGHGGPVVRARLGSAPWAPLKIASGCDRRCAFCAIPSFRGSFVSRRPSEVLDEARWLAGEGVRELLLVSENSTSYGKDLGDLALLEALLPELAAVEGVERVRVSYLQPAEVRPGLLETMAATPGVCAWYDLSFQHASTPVLRRMRRFGGTEAFLGLLEGVRERQPAAGARSNVIVGFPGETEADVEELERFLLAARLDVVGVFGYSDEDGTEAEGLPGHLRPEVVAERVERVTGLVEELTAQRALERVGEPVTVLVEEHDEDEDGLVLGRAEHQGPEVDGVCLLRVPAGRPRPQVGTFLQGAVVGAEGVDLLVEAR
ncbi:30S ribosomal protein S12 methylthiotransferase RimO [Phycicoccus endophyticus]|uniref:Ribosomal protein uS12 methylthiotransferase RimO n=1 Tax=Phycicoccus endophyticus TaxID=1690220 RepID=A0A7G9R3R8_9MICO|nr:30S ribosomal protein S12 methylthiotransferase RimO [Phycicoccus endophyticus]NHI18066.1 30S ribosomal protein S12 methylthiotransferase RimO [Phycicoccus endophyticus]QNN50243.1 30S ribosomal protein S12 methylthiotransferase RimO [Phycicoccus endophyticus]GGL26714.1 ribosomal protein S12 methylthiotransferase RimO [Phycicoccus endophyticus]